MAPRLVRCSMLLGVFALLGCTSSPDEPRRLEPIRAEEPCDTPLRVVPPQVITKERAEREAHDASCPMQVPGVRLAARNVPAGVELHFTTSGDVAELRQRVRDLATSHTHEGVALNGDCSCPLRGSDGAALMTEASTSAEPIPEGARLLLVPNERNEVIRLRARVSERLERFSRARCGEAAEAQAF